jgi:hypothetical protein
LQALPEAVRRHPELNGEMRGVSGGNIICRILQFQPEIPAPAE